MSPTSSLDRAGQDATSGATPSGGASMGSGGDDRPSENISIDFGRIDDKASGVQDGVQDTGNGGDRPTEEIGFSFTKPPEPTPAVASSPASGAASLDNDGDRPSENISLSFNRIDNQASDAQGHGSGGDDRPSENISLSFNRIDDKTSDAQVHGSGGADDFVLEPGTAGAEGSSGLLDFSGIDDKGLAEAEEPLAFDSASAPQPGGDSATLSAFEAAHADPTGDRIEDIVAAPRPVADDFIA